MKSFTPLVTDLMGAKLRISNGEEIGVVQNVMLNPSDGTIVFIFLCYANFMGKTHRHIAIPREELKFTKDDYSTLYFEIAGSLLRRNLRYNLTDETGRYYNENPAYIYRLSSEEKSYEALLTG